MAFIRFVVMVTLASVCSSGLLTAEEVAPPRGAAQATPLLCINSPGPSNAVSCLAFSPDGKTLYAGGRDRVIHVWQLKDGKFLNDRRSAFRVPLGTGLSGFIAAIAVSDDGHWLAVGGRGAARGLAEERDLTGHVSDIDGLSTEQLLDQGTIYVFDTSTRQVTAQRHHQGVIRALRFAPSHPNKPALLVSAAEVRDDDNPRFLELALWDVAAAKPPLACRSIFPDQTGMKWAKVAYEDKPTLPEIQVIHTGPELMAVRVAIVWSNTQFGRRIWEPASRDVTLKDPGPIQFFTCSADSSNPLSVWSCSYDLQKQQGQIGTWSLPTGAFPRGVAGVVNPINTPLDPSSVPVAAAPLSQGRLAVVTIDRTRFDHHLVLVDAGGGVGRSVPLWTPGRKSDSRPPHIATSSQGHIAVAGNEQNEILVFDSAEGLIVGPNPQRLSGRGRVVKSVAFVRKDAKLGLLLSPNKAPPKGDSPRDPKPEDSILDLTLPGLTNNATGWLTDRAPVSAWSLQEGTGEGNELSVFKNGDPVGKITIDDTPGVRLTVSDYVFCPGPIPLLVVASESQDHEPKLYVYNLENLQRVRELLAHSNRILDLAISGDGQFLVSTAADSTVRVWRLNDVRQSLGRRGQIRNGDHLLSVAVIDGAPARHEESRRSAQRRRDRRSRGERARSRIAKERTELQLVRTLAVARLAAHPPRQERRNHHCGAAEGRRRHQFPRPPLFPLLFPRA